MEKYENKKWKGKKEKKGRKKEKKGKAIYYRRAQIRAEQRERKGNGRKWERKKEKKNQRTECRNKWGRKGILVRVPKKTKKTWKKGSGWEGRNKNVKKAN